MDEDLSNNSYTKTEMKEMESMFMQTESDARWRFQKNGPYRPRSRLRSFSRTQGITDPEDNLSTIGQGEMEILINHNKIQELHNLHRIFFDVSVVNVEHVTK